MKIDARIIAINIALTLLLIFILNFCSNLGLLIFQEFNHVGIESKVGLPEFFKNQESTRIIYQEFAQLPSQYKPFIGWSRKPFQGVTTNIDANGDRLHINQASEDNLNKSVYFFGGSAMWGSGVTDRETIPALFNVVSGFPTFNKGERAFTSRQELARLINLLAQNEQIKTAIFYDGANDIAVHCRSELDVNEHLMTQKIRNLLEVNNKNSYQQFVNYLNVAFIQGTRNLVNIFVPKPQNSQEKLLICDRQQDRAMKVAQTLVNNWQIAHDIATARGINFFAILQPVAFIGKPKLNHLKEVDVYENYGIDIQYQTVYPLIQSIIKERGYQWVIDYTDMFSIDEPIYMDFVHVFANGNRIIANQLYQDIKSYLSK
ncbi:MAG: hypothetical protein RMZ69_20375 [Nostoc sp. ChiQUE01a]|nr:hypothetical protein [Nostoc sp. ChiQUE01a]